MKFNRISFRVRYGETDQMGIVYHGNYAQYMEMGRIEWLRELGISYKTMEENGIILPVISLSLDFKKSAYYDDEITVETRLVKEPLVKIEFDYVLTNQHREIVATGNTVLAFLNSETRKPIKCPDEILSKIRT